MTRTNDDNRSPRFSILQGVLPIKTSQIPNEIVAGITLAALAIPEVMGYTRISGTPLITGLYTILIPMALFAVFGSSRHLVVGADSATAAILAAGLVGLAATGSDEYVALAAVLAMMAAAFLILARIIWVGLPGRLLVAHSAHWLPDWGRYSGRAGRDLRDAGLERWRARYAVEDLERSPADRPGKWLCAGHRPQCGGCDRGFQAGLEENSQER